MDDIRPASALAVQDAGPAPAVAAGAAPPDLPGLMVAYQNGRPDAFDHLYRRLAPVVRRRLAALARDAAWADDLVQDTFLQLHRARASYDPAYPVEPWVLGIARHAFLVACRARRRRPDLGASPPSETMPELWQADHRGACLARHDLRRLLATLGRRSRHAVVLRHVYGMTDAEAASRLGIRPGAAKLRVCRAVTALRSRAGGRGPRSLTRPGGTRPTGAPRSRASAR